MPILWVIRSPMGLLPEVAIDHEGYVRLRGSGELDALESQRDMPMDLGYGRVFCIILFVRKKSARFTSAVVPTREIGRRDEKSISGLRTLVCINSGIELEAD